MQHLFATKQTQKLSKDKLGRTVSPWTIKVVAAQRRHTRAGRDAAAGMRHILSSCNIFRCTFQRAFCSLNEHRYYFIRQHPQIHPCLCKFISFNGNLHVYQYVGWSV